MEETDRIMVPDKHGYHHSLLHGDDRKHGYQGRSLRAAPRKRRSLVRLPAQRHDSRHSDRPQMPDGFAAFMTEVPINLGDHLGPAPGGILALSSSMMMS